MGLDHLLRHLDKLWKKLTDAIEWRLRARVGDDSFDGGIFRAGVRFRPYLKSTRFIGVAGSVGKTTAKDLLVGILKTSGKTIGNPLSRNAAPEIARTILRTRPWHRYCVAELGETGPDSLDDLLAAVQPSIGIVTVIGDDHLTAFGSRTAVAREFRKLVEAIPQHGSILLNRDDALVFGLQQHAVCHVITYGSNQNADLHASEIDATLPDTLRFTATYKGRSVPIRTQLYGKHLLTSALAAIGGGLAAGLTLEECARGISQVAPAEGRMQPASGDNSRTLIRDDFKSPAWTVRPLLEQIRDARAKRKIFILGTISDCQHKEAELHKLSKEALAVADIAIFTGPMASAALKARSTETESRLFAFSRILDLHTFLESINQEGDLIVIKGTNKKDHLSRIALAMSGQTVNCWVDDCGRDMFCSQCSHLKSCRAPPGLLMAIPEKAPVTESTTSPLPSAGNDDQFIIGLGNPGSEFAGTPHNVGHDAVDALCLLLDSQWKEYPDAWIAEAQFTNHRLWMIKLNAPMNLSGASLKRLSNAMGFDADRCILVFDDIDLPLGKVRTRMNGSAGGHRGVASILDAFQTDGFRRVKVGVRAKPGDAPAVLQRFDDEAGAMIRQSFPVVAEHVRQLAARR